MAVAAMGKPSMVDIVPSPLHFPDPATAPTAVSTAVPATNFDTGTIDTLVLPLSQEFTDQEAVPTAVPPTDFA